MRSHKAGSALPIMTVLSSFARYWNPLFSRPAISRSQHLENPGSPAWADRPSCPSREKTFPIDPRGSTCFDAQLRDSRVLPSSSSFLWLRSGLPRSVRCRPGGLCVRRSCLGWTQRSVRGPATVLSQYSSVSAMTSTALPLYFCNSFPVDIPAWWRVVATAMAFIKPQDVFGPFQSSLHRGSACRLTS
jgi:hypothetical protein